ncbi:MAG: putative drug exporter of the superfamily [Solirubrobacterales bacterium]|jgi:RND superfamily putative drug exporter|nr:putative drug exporter of the superfamily [Solirubrobacterales bacterium]
MAGLTRWVLAHKRIVTIGWILLTIAGIMAAGPATDALEPEFSVPDKEGWETNQVIAENYGGTGGDTAPLLPVVTLPEGESVDAPAVTADLEALDASLAEALPNSRIASYASTGDDAFVSADGTTVFAVIYPQPDPDSAFGENPEAEKAASAVVEDTTVAGSPVHLTGFDALFEDSGEDADGPSLLIEALIGGFGALLVLIFVFASFLAVVPLLMAFVSIMTTFLLLLGLTEITTVSPIVQFLIALIGLGVAIDYSLIVVSRWREERTHGASDEEAVQIAMEHAGRAVVFSGITVAIGLLALIALPLPFLRSMGYGGMLIPLVSTLVAITLLPVLLARFGGKLDWPHRRTDDKASRAWTRWAEAVSRRRWLAAGLGMAFIIALVGASFSLQLGTSDANTLAQGGDAKDGLDALVDSGVGEGALLPHEVLIDGSTDPETVAADLREVEGIHGAVAPEDPTWNQNGTALVEAIPIPDSGSSEGEDNLEAVRDTAHAAGSDVAVGGQPAANADFIDAVYGSFPLMIALIAVSTFILLARAFRSILLPIKAIILNVLSVAAAWGVLTIVWQNGNGSELIWGVEATGSVPSWIPLMVFAFLFGLSMDYEVFILSRMREEYDRTGSTETAVIQGIARTGRLVTSAALILFLAFMAMASAPGTDVRIMATGLAAGILLDATIIRALIVPAVISLMGRWNWWMPKWSAKLLRVEPSPLTAAEARS